MAYQIEERVHVDTIPPGEYLLVGDIGGTNSNFGVVRRDDLPSKLMISLRAHSQSVRRYDELIQQICDYLWQHYNISIRSACCGIAGVVQKHCRCVEPTNLDVTIDAEQITAATSLDELVIMNDFVAVATGVDHVADDAVVCVREGDPLPGGNKAALGAGTGLGMVGMLWHDPVQQHIPVASEGGHADFSPRNEFELSLAAYIQTQQQKNTPASWEDILNGQAIRHIYQFLGVYASYPETDISREIASSDYAPDKISVYADKDARARDTFELYARWSGRCAKNWVLQMLAFDGIYIAGGIAAQNMSVFHHEEFHTAFCDSDIHHEFLKKTPVYVIADYDVSLYGAAAYYRMRKQEIV